MFFDKPYYLEPTKQGRHAYALLREALADSNRVAIARVVIRTKEYIAAVKPIGDALVLELMHWASEIVASDTLDLPGDGEAAGERDADGSHAHRHDERGRVRAARSSPTTITTSCLR